MKKNLFLGVYLCCTLSLFSQENKENLNTLRQDAYLSSGNYRDILTNFFQAAFNDLTGEDKRFRFSSNLFAVKLKTNPELNLDQYYKQQTFWRNSNVDVDIKFADKFKFNGISFGYKYALCNRRDYTVSHHLTDLYKLRVEQYNQLRDYLAASVAKLSDKDRKKALINELSNFFNSEFVTYKDLSEELRNLIDNFYREEKITPDFNFKKSVDWVYDSLVNSFKNKLLWTLSAQFSTYSNGLIQDGVVQTQATAGLLRLTNLSNIEFDLKSSIILNRDSLGSSKNLNQIVKAEGALNYVHRNSNQMPVVEFKLGATYFNAPKNLLYPELTLDGGFRIRVTKTLWIPVTIKYDPERANLFGYLSVKSNFDWLSALLDSGLLSK